MAVTRQLDVVVVFFRNDLRARPEITPQVVNRRADIIDRIAPQMGAVGNAADQPVPFRCPAPARYLARPLEGIRESRQPGLRPTDLLFCEGGRSDRGRSRRVEGHCIPPRY